MGEEVPIDNAEPASKDTKQEKRKKTKEANPEVEIVRAPSNVKKNIFNTLFYFFLLLIFGLLIYLFIANLAFFGVIPKKTAYKMPIIGSIVQKMAVKENQIKLAKEVIEDKEQVQKAGQLNINLEEDADLQGPIEKVPFLYKIRVIKYKIKEKELAELWVDNVLAMQLYIGIGENTAYVRGKYIAQKLNDLINKKTDFNQLLPVIQSGNYKAIVAETELFRVSKEDAIFHNSTQQQLLYKWINQIRVPLGATLMEDPTLVVKESNIEKPETPTTQVATVSPTKNAINKQSEGVSDDKKIKNVAAIYEKMSLESITPIFAKMSPKEAEEILMYLSDKKLTKLFTALPPADAALYYKELTGGTLSNQGEKNFKKFANVWEKLPSEETLNIFKNLNKEQIQKIISKLSQKKKSKLLSDMQADDALNYLKLMKK